MNYNPAVIPMLTVRSAGWLWVDALPGEVQDSLGSWQATGHPNNPADRFHVPNHMVGAVS
ncbi:MAG: hypothetical protein RBT11_19635 [Desulfobacterales bacterium]|nr:hypothetical protein [Desulfobacterales bacterium]